jgi:hypothetical protein
MRSSGGPSSGLRQAASKVFVFTAVLPLLIFTWTLYRLDVIDSSEAQVGLILALVVALLGFGIFRSLMSRLSEVIQALGAAAATPEQPPGAAVPAATSEIPVGPARPRDLTVPGLGTIHELRGIAGAMSAIWMREAVPYVGRRVLVSVLRSSRPIAGTLVNVTEDGVLLENGDEQIAVAYRRVSGIQLDA